MFSKVLSLEKSSCPQIWNIEQEKDREKETIGCRPAKLNRRQEEEQHENFVAAVEKREILAATNAR